VAYRLRELAERIGGTVHGDPERRITGIATLDRAGPDELSFFTNPRYRRQAEETTAGALLVGPGSRLGGRDLLEAPQPYLALAELLELFHPAPRRRPEISELAHVDPGAEIGREVHIGPFAVIEAGVSLEDRVTVGAGSVIGAGCTVGPATELRPRVVLYPGTRVGARCLIHAGVVLGGDGFGFAPTTGGGQRKVPQLGHVVLEDDVEIGPNSTVDRGALGETRVGAGTKIDNLVMVAHGVRLGPGCLLAAQAGIAGSTRVGARVTFAGQSGAAGHLEIAEGSVIGGKTAVFGDVPEAAFVAGIPAIDHRVWKRSQALVQKLPQLRSEIRELKTRLAELEKKVP
jgi:UDP-3-O-[3-hydroxymyristoyl] glucosamine N-acyltransferase